MKFEEFGKIYRFLRPMIATEKIDGTNASVWIWTREEFPQDELVNPSNQIFPVDTENGSFVLMAGSRTRFVGIGNDNHGWAGWVKQNAKELAQLGPGRHFGEWWGAGIQRKYGLKEKRFSLFNVNRWQDTHGTNDAFQDRVTAKGIAPKCCYVAPILNVIETGLYRIHTMAVGVNEALAGLATNGSKAAPGFMDPEGIVLFHTASGDTYKITLGDDGHKGA